MRSTNFLYICISPISLRAASAAAPNSFGPAVVFDEPELADESLELEELLDELLDPDELLEALEAVEPDDRAVSGTF